jgi:hypothetical protein
LNGKFFHSSLSNGSKSLTKPINYPLPPFAQVNVELNIDITKNLLIVHLAFDEQADFFIHIQLLNNKILKKLHNAWKKRRSSLQLSTLKNLHEKTTKF